MSKTILIIARDEWRYWQRSRLSLAVLIIALSLVAASVWVTKVSNTDNAHQRAHMQSQAEHSFKDQPDRHPHRMVHYGHYVFRSLPPLGALDPGIDALTGNAIFLEGHRQNSATLADKKQSSGLTWISSLTPAFVMQIIAPLLLIILGFSMVTREREAGTLDFLKVQGVSLLALLAGKGLALVTAAVLISTPLIIGVMISVINGAGLLSATAFIASYWLYLIIWSAIVLLISTLVRTNASSFSGLIAIWILTCLIIPRVASNTAGVIVHAPGKLETDLAILRQLREIGDGHNMSSRANSAMRDSLLAKYNVKSVDALPVNFKGIVAQQSEADLTKVLNKFARQQMHQQTGQAEIFRYFGWLSPMIAIQNASMKLAATDLENYHEFLQQAETARYDFVQSLNRLHAENMTLEQDSNKYRNDVAKKAATVSADNWQILSDFSFSPLSEKQRITNSLFAISQLLLMLGALLATLSFAGKRL
ncbi:DUF3526 domain-containing protein [Salinimonas sp. HHU 13199]|uniref:DUF3526 domain-containing protein n=1 Tax=Salinimonas profundi TaxID=2729140 RepID=A0ABR8LL47_9ALTE|nr:DUF3526 domain-containing protein [Salinimonas profundi]MBD3586919.1 DUF3526 domain-containing protein [Salinimonas profundi]